MVFKKINAKAKRGRGGGPDMIIKTLAENWDEWKGSLADLSVKERDDMITEFDCACTGAGDALQADDPVEFTGEASGWGKEDKEAFCKVLSPAYFEC